MELSKLVEKIYDDNKGSFQNDDLMYEQCILPKLFKNNNSKQRFLFISWCHNNQP